MLVHLRDPHADVVLPVAANASLRSGLGGEVELLLDRVGELAHERDHVDPEPHGGAALQEARERQHRLGVARHDVGDARTLDLDDHALTRGEHRAVHLTDRRRGQWLPVERREHLFDRPTQLERRAQTRTEGRIGDPRGRREPSVQEPLALRDAQHLLEPQRWGEGALHPTDRVGHVRESTEAVLPGAAGRARDELPRDRETHGRDDRERGDPDGEVEIRRKAVPV